MIDNSLPYQIISIPIADIVFPSGEMRSQVSFEGLDELSRSIRHLGLLNPITVRKMGEKYELIAGFRRTKAVEMTGAMVIPARVVTSDDPTADLQKAHENLFREDVNPVDEGRYLKLILAKNAWKLEDLAAAVHKSLSYVSRRIALTDLPEDVSDSLKDGRINLSIAEELTRIKDPTSRLRLLHLTIANGATVDVVRSWRIQQEVDQSFRQPHTPDGSGQPGGSDPAGIAKMGALADDHGPQIELSESCRAYRVCHSCLAKTDEKDCKLLILCPGCASALEQYLPGGQPAKKEPQNATN